MIRIIEKLKNIDNGGIETFIFCSLPLVKSNNFSFSVYSDNEPTASRYVETAEKSDISLICPQKKFRRINSRLLRLPAKWICFYKFCRNNTDNIIHIHLSRPFDVVYAISARAAGCRKIILHSHSSQRMDRHAIEKTADPFLRAICRSISNVKLACSENAAIYMYGSKIVKSGRYTVINNGIDTTRFTYDPETSCGIKRKLGIEGKTVIGNIGRLSYAKNQSFLLDITYEALKKNPDVVLLIVGGGELEKELKEKTDTIGISDNVIFYGASENTAELYQAMDCFVFPSHYEGLGIAAVEAQCSGLPVICSDKVPHEAAVTELCSFMSLNSSADEWADCILKKCSEHERTDHSAEVAAAGYDIHQTAEQLKTIYNDLIK